MTCLTCGATLETTDTTCPVCSAPVSPAAAGPADGPPSSGGDADGPRSSAEDAEETVTQRIGEPSEPPRPADDGDGEDAAMGRPPSASGGSSAAGRAAAGGYGGQPAIGPGRAAPGAGSPGVGGPGAGGPGVGGPVAAGWQRQATHPSGLSSETRGWGIAAHLIGLGGALLTAVTLGFAGPLIVWLLKRDDHPFIDHHAKEALNFQLTTLVALLVGLLAAIPVFLLGFLTFGVLWLVAVVVILAATVVWFVFPIIGAVKAANGEGYRYPVNIRFVR